MKKNTLLFAITGLILTISFQNCSQGNFQASDLGQTTQSYKTVVSDDQIQNWLDKEEAIACPAIRCAAAPEGCFYEQDNSVDSACPTGCGRLVCKEFSGPNRVPTRPIACPMIACAEVPAGCKRVAAASTVKDANGCDLNCGEVVCDSKEASDSSGEDHLFQENRRICPAIRCMAAPANCYYRQTSTIRGHNECPTCGELICKKFPVDTDLPSVLTE